LAQFYSELDEYLIWINDTNKEIQVIAAMLIGSLARTEENCVDMVKRGIAGALIEIIRDEARDLRVRHYCTGTLRNISINPTNKHLLLKGGIMEPVVKLLQQPKMNQVVVYQAIGVIKNLLSGGEEFTKAFIEVEGLPNILKLTNDDESDHLKFESCRVVALLAKDFSPLASTIVSSGGLTALSTLLNSKFEVLKSEGAHAIKSLIQHGHTKSVAFSDGLVSGLLNVLSSGDTLDIKLLVQSILHDITRMPEASKHVLSCGGLEIVRNSNFGNSPDSQTLKSEILSALESVSQ